MPKNPSPNTLPNPNPFRGRRTGINRLIVPAILLVILAVRYYMAGPEEATRFEAESIPATTYAVERVVDGDTLIVQLDDPPGSELRRERLRLLGIDTPETVKEDTPVEAWGPEASAFTKQFVAGGKVQLEFDKRRVDQYGRYLAYVYVDGQMLNEALVAEGLARVSFYDGDDAAMLRRFRKAESAAKEARKGIWSGRDK